MKPSHYDSDRNAEQFARQLESRFHQEAGQPPEEQHEEPQHVPAAPPAPESRILRERPHRTTTADQFADLMRHARYSAF